MGRCGRRRSTPRICGRNGTRLEQGRVCIPRPPCPAPRDTQQQTLRLAGCPCAGAEAGMKGFSFRDGLLLLRITEADSETFCACKATGRKRRRIRKNGRISRKRCRECIWRLILPDSSTANGGSCSSAASVCFEKRNHGEHSWNLRCPRRSFRSMPPDGGDLEKTGLSADMQC